MRAIEEGLPVLPSTTTGISAVIDVGRVVRGSGALEGGKLEGRRSRSQNRRRFRAGRPLAWTLGWALCGRAGPCFAKSALR